MQASRARAHPTPAPETPQGRNLCSSRPAEKTRAMRSRLVTAKPMDADSSMIPTALETAAGADALSPSLRPSPIDTLESLDTSHVSPALEVLVNPAMLW